MFCPPFYNQMLIVDNPKDLKAFEFQWLMAFGIVLGIVDVN